MADRTIKPDDTNDLIISNNHGGAKIEVNEGDDIEVTATELAINGGKLRVSRADSTPQGTAESVFNDAIFGSTDTKNTGITIFGSGQTGMAFGDSGDEDIGSVRYQHSTNQLELVSNANVRMTIENDGDVTIEDGDLIIGTAGHGIDFHNYGSGVDSNKLNDYEAGTWSITNTDGSVFSTTNCMYTKIGRMVHIQGYFVVATGDSTSTSFGGLPFTIKNNEASRGLGFVSYQSETTTSGFYYGVYGNKNTKNFQFQSTGSSTFSEEKEVYFTLIYTTDE